jgi:hypothetical protein
VEKVHRVFTAGNVKAGYLHTWRGELAGGLTAGSDRYDMVALVAL